MANVLILGSPRSGTHALGSHMSVIDGMVNLGEICRVDEKTDPVQDIKRLLYTTQPSVAHVVQMVSKVKISGMIAEIKQNCQIILLRRRDKIKQFASWMYFHRAGGVMVDWHNHKQQQMRVEQQEIEVSESEIEQFILEQMLDDFFQPDTILYYEDLDLSKSTIQKNQYAWQLPLIFSNLDFVESRLRDWAYHDSR